MFPRVVLLGVWLAVRPPPGTDWHVRTSLGFDALCALNVLSGDPYYVAQYPRDTQTFNAPRYAAARAAAQRLKTVIKEERGGIVSAFLTLIFSGGPDSSLAALLAEARHPDGLERRLRASPYWSDDTWQAFARVRPDVIAALEGLEQAGFAADWHAHALGARAAALRDSLGRFDVLGEQARLLGHAPGEGIEVILLYYSRPHGIRIQGPRFLTNAGYPIGIILQNAAHEPLHPPFDGQRPEIRAVLDALGRDTLLAHIVTTHDRAFGYNTLDGYVDEDAVQALEQVVAERLGFAREPAQRWRAADGGMHLLAAALYDLMHETGFARRGGRFADWLVAQEARGALRPAGIERRARRVLGDAAVDRWRPGSARER